ncbi:MAG: CRISPR-associated endonuclease Cas6 [Saprospiraceae bacterium]|nr:hypothetical protein [Lewinella sp.]
MNLSILAATFDLPLESRDIPRWRSAWAEMAGFEHDRFHNHKPGDEGVIYRYPLVQYRVRRGRAAIMALDQATMDVQQALTAKAWEITWDYQPLEIGLEDLRLETYELHLDRQSHEYRLRSYLPFNDRNFDRWNKAPNLIARIRLLESLIAGHLLNFATGVGWKIPGRFDVELLHLDRAYTRPLHEIQRPAFDLVFKTNLFVPAGIGLGKGVSHGYGLLLPMRKEDI